MADDIRETINVDTEDAQRNLKDLEDKSKDADTALDELKQTAGKVDQETVTVDVDVPGALEAKDKLDDIDQAGRRAGGGVKVGVADMSDVLGPLGDVAGKAGEAGQAFEGLGTFAEGAAAKMGASEATIGKIGGAVGGLAVGAGLAAAAYGYLQEKSAEAKKALEELQTAFENTQAALEKGDTEAAAQAFVDQIGTKIQEISKKAGVSPEGVVQAIIGDKSALEDFVRLAGESGEGLGGLNDQIYGLRYQWDQAKASFDATNQLKDTVVGAFNQMKTAQGDFATATEDAAARFEYAQIRILGAANQTAAQLGQTTSGPHPTAPSTLAALGVGNGVIVNNFPPANTPLAVETATQEFAHVQGPR